MSKDTAFNGERAPRHTFLCSDLQCLPHGDPKILCAKHEYPITGKSFITNLAVIACKLLNLSASNIENILHCYASELKLNYG